MMPYEKFKSLLNAEKHLKLEVTFEILDAIANKRRMKAKTNQRKPTKPNTSQRAAA
ncbi:MAG: hypothetical protein ACR2PJ_00890 [Pseudomonadales bacterium]